MAAPHFRQLSGSLGSLRTRTRHSRKGRGKTSKVEELQRTNSSWPRWRLMPKENVVSPGGASSCTWPAPLAFLSASSFMRGETHFGRLTCHIRTPRMSEHCTLVVVFKCTSQSLCGLQITAGGCHPSGRILCSKSCTEICLERRCFGLSVEFSGTEIRVLLSV